MKILIVEDDEQLQQFLKNALESEMFVVDAVGDGETAIKHVLMYDYDLVILDNLLPKKDGHTVCTEIRNNNRTMPILMLSTLSEAEKKTALLNAGADDYLTKPFDLTELLARIRALLRRPTIFKEPILELRGIILDTLANTVKVNGRLVDLTRKEFMLLHNLMRHSDTVLTRAMLLDRVWDMNVDIFSNTIESHILSLRKKIGDIDKSDMIIKTVSGRGYKFSTTN